MSDSTGDYKVGYGKPPENTRFKKGASGNPRGRPKKQRVEPGLTDVERVYNEVFEVHTPQGGKRKVTGFEAMLLGLIKEGLKGSTPAIKQILKIRRDLMRVIIATQPDPIRVTDHPYIGLLVPAPIPAALWDAINTHEINLNE